MGTGIMAAIPIVFKPHEYRTIDPRDFSKGFLNNYDESDMDGKQIYTIKESLLVNNYKSFLSEFYELIDEDFFKKANINITDLPDVHNLDAFIKFFKGGDNRVPFMFHASFFSVLGCRCVEYWLFYFGSYQAILETYCTLLHFEKILAKTMGNPLANAIKFGIFG